MNRLEALLESLLDRLAVKLASKVRAQLNGAVDSALDRAEDRIEEALERLEERLLAAANKAMADVLQQALRPVADLQQAVAPALKLQQQMQVVAEAVGVTPMEAAKAAGGYVTEEQLRKAAQAAGMKTVAELQQQIRAGAIASAVDARNQFLHELRTNWNPRGPQERLDLAEQLRSRLSADASRAAEEYRLEDAARAARLEIPDR